MLNLPGYPFHLPQALNKVKVKVKLGVELTVDKRVNGLWKAIFYFNGQKIHILQREMARSG